MLLKSLCYLTFVIVCVALAFQVAVAGENLALHGFATGGHTVYHLRLGRMQPEDEQVIIAAATDGTVMCLSKSGKLIWKNQDSQSLPLDLDVTDIDRDGRDETLVASADGALYVLDVQGRLKWRFAREAPLIQVSVVKGDNQPTVILTGGIEKTLYALSPDGKIVSSLQSPHVVRHIRGGNFLAHGKNGHNVNHYEPTQTPMVFDRMDCYWGGAPTMEVDFSRYAMGSRSRMLNFLPTSPFGLIATVPADTSLEDLPLFRSMLVTDGKWFYDGEASVPAAEYKSRALLKRHLHVPIVLADRDFTSHCFGVRRSAGNDDCSSDVSCVAKRVCAKQWHDSNRQND